MKKGKAFLSVWILLGILCGGTPSPGLSDERILEGAKSEGKLVFYTGIFDSEARAFLAAFEKKYPFIKTSFYRGAGGPALVARIQSEQRAGAHLWDVYNSAGLEGFVLWEQGYFGKYDSPERKHYPEGFKDAEGYWTTMYTTPFVASYNTRMASPSELPKNYFDLLDPKWKGKAIYQDVRSGLTFAVMTAVRVGQGEEMLRRLIVDQEPAFSRDVRQIVESMVRGRYAFSNSVTKPVLQQFLDEGQGRNIRLIDISDMSYITNANALWVVNRAPHPNAARLLANWIPTRAGQEAFSKFVESNSRRSDIPPHDPLAMPKPGQRYLRVGPEDTLPELDKTQALLNEWVGIRN